MLRPWARASLFTIFALAALHPDARGAGFALFEQGAPAMGRAGAYVAGASNPSAVFFNPAALAGVKGTRVGLTPSLIFFNESFAGSDPYPGYGTTGETAHRGFPLPAAYLSHEFSDRVTGGLGFTAPYGLETDWRDSPNFPGRFLSQRARIERLEVSGALGVELSPALRVGGALNMGISRVILQKALAAQLPGEPTAVEIGTASLESPRQSGLSGTLALQALPSDKVKFGLVVRTGSTSEFTAPAHLAYGPIHTGNANEDSLIQSQLPRDQDASVRVRFPLMVMTGIEYAFSTAFHGEVDLNWTRWSVFDTVSILFSKDPAFNIYTPQDFKNALAVRAGVEYAPPGRWTIRGGAYYDVTPQPATTLSPLLADTDRVGLTAGLGYDAGPFRLDTYALLVLFRNRSTDGTSVLHLDGSYKPRAFTVGLGLGFAL